MIHQPSAIDACLEIAAEMRAVANDPAAALTIEKRQELKALAVSIEQILSNLIWTRDDETTERRWRRAGVIFSYKVAYVGAGR